MPFPNFLHLRSALFRAVIPVGGTLLIGCEATGPRSPASVSLSVAAMPRSTNVGTGANSVRVTSVEFLLAETELAPGATCSTAPAGTDWCDALHLDPLLINLPLGAAPPRKVLDAPVSAGTYGGLQAKLRSLRVNGVYTDANGVPHDFTFTSAGDAQLQIAFNRPVTVRASRNLTLLANVAAWFRDRRGGRLVIDPRSSANASAIVANVERSFQAFQDDDEDGVEDDPAEVEDDTTEVDDDTTEVEDDTTEVEDDTTEVEDDTTDVDIDTTGTRDAAGAALLSLFRTSAGR